MAERETFPTDPEWEKKVEDELQVPAPVAGLHDGPAGHGWGVAAAAADPSFWRFWPRHVRLRHVEYARRAPHALRTVTSWTRRRSDHRPREFGQSGQRPRSLTSRRKNRLEYVAKKGIDTSFHPESPSSTPLDAVHKGCLQAKRKRARPEMIGELPSSQHEAHAP
jgi:hypothetical protein